MLVHSTTKFNRKWQPTGIISRIDLAAGVRVAVKGQNVIPCMEQIGRNPKMRFSIGILATDFQSQERMPSPILELANVAREAPRGYKVEIQKESLSGLNRKRAALFAGSVHASQGIRIE
jgi:hypothetical protein